MTYDYDLVTIGAGSGGVRASRVAANHGARVAVVEERFLGGTCVNVGCIPKKLFVYAAHVPDEVEEAAGFGWSIPSGARHDWNTLQTRKDTEIGRLQAIYERLLHGAGCTIVRGRGRLIDPHTVEVAAADGRTSRLTAKHILVATGGTPRRPREFIGEDIWTSDDVFRAKERPERIAVVGGGYIALEMACVFHGLGSEVTLIHRGPHPLRGFDDDARFFLLEELRKRGLSFRLNCRVECIERTSKGAQTLMLSGDETLEVDQTLYAIGRDPNTRDLGLETVGVALAENGAIKVDDGFRTSVPSIYALGDVTDRMNLTPVAIAEGMALAEALFDSRPRTVDYRTVPTAIFSTPPLATVGLHEAKARNEHSRVDVYTSEFRPLKHTLSGSSARMFVKMIVDASDQRVLGIHLVGPDAPEMIQGFAVALTCGATKAQFDATLGLHPTAAEELVTLREPRPKE